VVKTGTGKDMRFMDTRTGQSFAAPSYGAFSFKGLTSTDPANVARNRYGREALDRMGSGREGGMDRSGIVSLVEPTTPETPPAPTPEELAAIGAPTTPMAPIFVDSPAYTQYDSLAALGPQGGYGMAFGPMTNPYQSPMFDAMFNSYQGMGGIDIFSPYGMR